MEEQHTNIRLILDKIMRHPLMRDLSLETAIDYTVDFMRIVGCPAMFENKVALLEVSEYRAPLPCDFYSMEQVRLMGESGKPSFRYTTDTFHLSGCKPPDEGALTYKIQNNVIFTSIKEGSIEISYEAVQTDGEGYPVLPDNSSFTRALESYIKKQWFTILFDLSKISGQVLQNAQTDYAWNVGNCRTDMSLISVDKAESLFNSWRTLIARTTEHRTGFIDNGTQERIKQH